MDLFQEYIFKSRYARFIWKENRRETWEEAVQRYIDYIKKRTNNVLPQDTYADIHQAILKMEIMPSMRLLMTAGEPLDAHGDVCAYNCSYIPVDSPRAFDEVLYILMCGTGVGFSVERSNTTKLPVVADEFHTTETTIQVQDSKIGWAKALKELIHLLYGGQIPVVDVSLLRPQGAPLKTFGGRSSGPGPFMDLVKFTISLFKKAQGRKLTSLECHDLVCKIADVVVVGGVRRSALISLSDLEDPLLRDAKAGNWYTDNVQRALANNTWVHDQSGRPDMGTFMKEWVSLYESKSGERGIFNRNAAKEKIAQLETDRDSEYNFGLNPCVPGNTPILTDKGYLEIEDLVGKKVKVWNGTSWSEVEPFSTGHNSTVTVKLSDGTELACTPWHEFIVKEGFTGQGKTYRKKAEDLVPGDKLEKFDMPFVDAGEYVPGCGYSQGFYSGDGTTGYSYSYLYEPKYPCQGRLQGIFQEQETAKSPRKKWVHGSQMLPKDFVPVKANAKYCLNWLAGILDSDGTVTRDENGEGFQISAIDKTFLQNIRLMLSRLGVRAKVIGGSKEGFRTLPDGNGGSKEYFCQKGYRLLIGNWDAASLINKGLKLERLKHHGGFPQRDARQFVRVLSIEDSEPCETFCFNEPLLHQGTFAGIVTGQCAEIILRPYEFCNLTEVVCRSADTLKDLNRKVILASILGTIQSSFTNFKYINKKWKQNCEEERLLGVSLTGIMDNPHLNKDWATLASDLQVLKLAAENANAYHSALLGIPASKAITCVKPSGTVSSLVDSSPGIHTRYAPYYVRRVRADINDPLCKLMIDQGVPYEKDITKPEHTLVFSFPIKAPDGSVFRNDWTAIEHLEHYKTFLQNWCHHNPSITVTVKEDEWMQVGSWLYDNFEETVACSFLPHSDMVYQQAPYEEIDKETYTKMQEKMPKSIDWSKLSEYEKYDQTTGSQELACTAGACDL